MKLWYSTTSPYVRRVMVTLKYHKLENKTDLMRIDMASDPNSPHNQDNPLGRVPALQRDNQEWLFGSLLICEYLDQLAPVGGVASLFPQGENRWPILNIHALAEGIIDNTVPIILEKNAVSEEKWNLKRHQQIHERNTRSFHYLEKQIDWLGNGLNIATIALVAAIDWFIFRQKITEIDMQARFAKLTAWAQEMNQQYPILEQTKPYFGS